MSLNKLIFGEPQIEKKCKKIIKDKKLSSQEKMSQILSNYIKYFNTRYVYEVNFAVYENYFEYFTLPSGKKDDEKYVEVFNESMAYYTLCHIINLYGFYESLVNNVNKELFDIEQKKLIKNLESFGKLESIICNRNDLYGRQKKVTQAFDLINDKILKDCTNGLVSINFFTKDETYEK